MKKIVGVTNAEGPPVPIPNTEVKLCSGENTLRATVREDSSMLQSLTSVFGMGTGGPSAFVTLTNFSVNHYSLNIEQHNLSR